MNSAAFIIETLQNLTDVPWIFHLNLWKILKAPYTPAENSDFVNTNGSTVSGISAEWLNFIHLIQ